MKRIIRPTMAPMELNDFKQVLMITCKLDINLKNTITRVTSSEMMYMKICTWQLPACVTKNTKY